MAKTLGAVVMGWLAELGRRNVLRVAMAYLVTAWLLVQVSDVVAPALHLPEWVGTLTVWLLMIGLVPTLLLAWWFEWTPQGPVRDGRRGRRGAPVQESSTSESARLKRAHRIDLAIIGVLALLLGWTWIDRAPRDLTAPPTSPSDTAERGIAVLPFVAMSEDKADEFLADGLSEEILNRLVGSTRLRVVGRTSSFAYKGRTEDLRGIAQALGVDVLLEGSVRRAGDALRVTAQLVDGRDGMHLWSHTYNFRLENIFQIQDAVAVDVAQQLAVSLAPPSRAIEPTTTHPQAMALYLQAKAARETADPQMATQALVWINDAIEIDPSYAEAHALRALIEIDQVSGGVVPDEIAIRRARQAVDRALQLAPESPAVLSAAVRVLIWEADLTGEFDTILQARALSDQALALGLDDVDTRLRHGFVLMQMGEFRASESVLRPLQTTEPLSELHRGWLSSMLIELGHREVARMQALRLPTSSPTRHQLISRLATALTPIEAVHGELVACVNKGDVGCYWRLCVFFFDLGDDETAVAALEAIPEDQSSRREFARIWAMQIRGEWGPAKQFVLKRFPDLIDAPYFWLDNLADQATAEADWPEALRLWRRIEPALFDAQPRSFMLANSAINVAYTLQQTGDTDGAERIWRMLDRHADEEPSFVGNADRVLNAVLAAHALGLREKARDRLAAAISAGFRHERRFVYTVDRTPFPAASVAREDPLLRPLLAELRASNRADLQRLHAHLIAKQQPAIPKWSQKPALREAVTLMGPPQ